MSESIAMYWWDDAKHGGNFGDAVSPKIVKALSGKKIDKVKAGDEPRLLACGSIIKWARKGDHLWGTGHAKIEHETAQGVEVHAVRGPLTRAALQAKGVECPEVFGDPALLLPLLYGPRKLERSYKFGIVPHYVDHQRAKVVLNDQLKRDDVLLIDVMGGPENVIDQIHACDFIASSSLHGIVAAEAYGVPALWVEFSDSVAGGGMKFRDYYLSLRERFCRAVNWRHKASLGTLEDHASLPQAERLVQVQTDLIGSAPFELAAPISAAHVRDQEGWVQS